MLTFKVSGSFARTMSFLKSAEKIPAVIARALEEAGVEGVTQLAAATPFGSGLAASSWYYKTSGRNGVYSVTWFNSDVENGFPVAIMLQYGYGTGTGGFVQGEDYINPVLKPIFDEIAAKVWKVVTSA